VCAEVCEWNLEHREVRDDWNEVVWEEADPQKRNIHAGYREWKDKNEYACLKEAMKKGEDSCFLFPKETDGLGGTLTEMILYIVKGASCAKDTRQAFFMNIKVVTVLSMNQCVVLNVLTTMLVSEAGIISRHRTEGQERIAVHSNGKQRSCRRSAFCVSLSSYFHRTINRFHPASSHTIHRCWYSEN
jgi:hypothetical protein